MVYKKRSRKILSLLVLNDVFFTSLAFILAYFIRFHSGAFSSPKGIPEFSQYYNLIPVIIIIWLSVFTLQKLYRARRGKSLVDEFFTIMLGVVLSTFILLSGLLFYRVYYGFDPQISSKYEYSRLAIAIFIVLNIVLVAFGRVILRKLIQYYRKKGYNRIKILIAGAGDLGRKVADQLMERAEYGYDIIGFVDDDQAKKKLVYNGIPVLGKLNDFKAIAEEREINSVFITLPLYAYKKLLKLINEGSEEGIDIKLFPDLMQYIALSAQLEELDGMPVINLNQPRVNTFWWGVKRVIDIVFSLGFLLTLTIIPLIPFLVLAIKLTSKGPVFYKQERMGMDGKLFNIYKFRSMVVDAEEKTGPVFADEDDPRVTKIGKLLRYYNLDEIPQFLNVIKGDMSIVGPRPERPNFVKEFKKEIPRYMLRHKVKSGITGWAQVNGWRGKTSIERRIEYDLYYIENWSLRLDLTIMWRTFLHWILRRPIPEDNENAMKEKLK